MSFLSMLASFLRQSKKCENADAWFVMLEISLSIDFPDIGSKVNLAGGEDMLEMDDVMSRSMGSQFGCRERRKREILSDEEPEFTERI